MRSYNYLLFFVAHDLHRSRRFPSHFTCLSDNMLGLIAGSDIQRIPSAGTPFGNSKRRQHVRLFSAATSLVFSPRRTRHNANYIAVSIFRIRNKFIIYNTHKYTLHFGLRFVDKGADTGSRVTTTGVNQDREEAAGKNRTEEMVTGIDDEGEIRTEEMITGVDDEGVNRTEERKEICAGATLMATHAYTRNPESPLGKEIDLQQWDTLIFKGEHAENEHWRLVEDRNGQVGYAPAAFLMVILDTTAEEEESSATKKGQENSTDENQIGGWVGQEGERRKSYSAAVIDGIKRNSRIYVGDSIVRKTDTRLSKEEDVVVCLPGARIEHVTERVEKIMGRGKGGTILVHIGTNNADKEGTTAIVDKYRKLLKKTKEARVEQIILSGILPVFGNRLDGYRNAKRMAINGMVKRLCMEEDVGYVDLWDSLVGKEEMYARDGLHLSGKGAAVFAEGLSGAVASGLGKVRYLN